MTRWCVLLFLVSAVCLFAQTAIDLGSQARNVDFSRAASTRPFKTSAALPASCVTGEVLFKTDEAVGKNVYLCTATDTWVRQQQDTAFSSIEGVAAIEQGGTGANTATAARANLGLVLGSTVQPFSPLLTQLAALTDCTSDGKILKMINGAWGCGDDVNGESNPTGGGASYTAGTGIRIADGEIGVDPATVPTFITVSATTSGWGTVTTGCTDQSISFPGAQSNDAVVPKWPATLPRGVWGVMFINAINSLNVRLCGNNVAVPDGLQFGATIVRSF